MTGCDVYGSFLQGAEKGMRGALSLLPALCAMLLMLAVMNASGLTELFSRLASPLTGVMHLPAEAAPMLLLRPLTGSGSLAAMERIFETCGPDSRAGRIASVLMGSSETIFYTMTVYLGAAGVKKLPYVMTVSLTAYFFSAALCGWLM
jgi:spore maturation protein B